MFCLFSPFSHSFFSFILILSLFLSHRLPKSLYPFLSLSPFLSTSFSIFSLSFAISFSLFLLFLSFSPFLSLTLHPIFLSLPLSRFPSKTVQCFLFFDRESFFLSETFHPHSISSRKIFRRLRHAAAAATPTTTACRSPSAECAM